MSEDVRAYILGALLTLGGLLVGAILLAVSGLYNVSAAREHFDATTWILDVVRRSSVRTQSLGIDVPPLADPGMVELGARYFEFGCAPCHGAPDRKPSPLSSAMLPQAPPLTQAAADWSSAELFWIVHNGQKFTGMPAWLDFRREDEVWPVVAFLQQLPDIDGPTYERLVGGGTDPAPPDFLDADAATVSTCVRCHGPATGQPISPRVPRLGGQSAAYLSRALREFEQAARPSGMMEFFAAGLTQTQIDALAGYYAAASAPVEETFPAPNVGNPDKGAQIFAFGVPGQAVPACISCHVQAANPAIPKLSGQSADYVRQQLEIWREGLRRASAYGAIMGRIAERMTPEQMADVAAYIDSLPPFGTQEHAQ
jgi:cytochrome c553